MSGPFNPRAGTFGGWPSQPNKRTLALGTVGTEVGYLEGSLYWCSGQNLYVDPNWGPWLFNSADQAALVNFQTFWGLPVTGVCDAATWGVIDYNNALHGRY